MSPRMWIIEIGTPKSAAVSQTSESWNHFSFHMIHLMLVIYVNNPEYNGLH